VSAIDPDEIDRWKREPQKWDDDPVPITHLQMLKIANIVDAAGKGHVGYLDELGWVSQLLQLRVMEVAGKPHLAKAREEAWARLDALPWPPEGPPKPQQL
jgi:hypothetical protein